MGIVQYLFSSCSGPFSPLRRAGRTAWRAAIRAASAGRDGTRARCAGGVRNRCGRRGTDSVPKTLPRPLRGCSESASPPRSHRGGAGRSRSGKLRPRRRMRSQRAIQMSTASASVSGRRSGAIAAGTCNANCRLTWRAYGYGGRRFAAGLDFGGRGFSIGGNVSDLMTTSRRSRTALAAPRPP